MQYSFCGALAPAFSPPFVSLFQEEFNRAKRSLQSFYMMNLEQKIVVMEDIGRQVLSQNMRHEADYYYDKIGTSCLLSNLIVKVPIAPN